MRNVDRKVTRAEIEKITKEKTAKSEKTIRSFRPKEQILVVISFIYISELFLNQLSLEVADVTTFNLDQSEQRHFLEASDWSVETTLYC